MNQILKPSHREKKRYILYRVEGLQGKIAKYLKAELVSLLGIWAAAEAGVMIVEEKDGYGILRVTTKSLERVVASLGMIRTLKGKNVRIDVIYISGTLKKIRNILKSRREV